MPRSSAAETVARQIQQLIEQRQEHADAIARIDNMLERVGAALGNGAVGRGGRRTSVSTTNQEQAPASRRSRHRRKFASSAEESILSFVKIHKNPTTKDLKKLWADEGRGGTADNALSKLVKEKKLKRTPLEGQRGSRFALA